MARLTSEQTTRLWTQPIRADSARLTIPLDALASLPYGASYQAKHGRANVKAYVEEAKQEGGVPKPTIIVEATCDSLEQLYIEQTIRADSLQRQFDYMSQQLQEAYVNSIQTPIKQRSNGILPWVLIAVVVVAILLKARP